MCEFAFTIPKLSGCIAWDNEQGDCNHGCALSRSACNETSFVGCLVSRLKNMVQLRRNQNDVQHGEIGIIYAPPNVIFCGQGVGISQKGKWKTVGVGDGSLELYYRSCHPDLIEIDHWLLFLN